jgi:hypothetical protein
MLGQPVPEQVVGHPDAQRHAVVGDDRGGLEPGVENVTVNLGFDAGEDLIPNAAAGHDARL